MRKNQITITENLQLSHLAQRNRQTNANRLYHLHQHKIHIRLSRHNNNNNNTQSVTQPLPLAVGAFYEKPESFLDVGEREDGDDDSEIIEEQDVKK